MAFKEERLAMFGAGVAFVSFALTFGAFTRARALALTRGFLQRLNRWRRRARRAHFWLDNSSERGRSGNGPGIGRGGGARRCGGLFAAGRRRGFLQARNQAVEACGKARNVEVQRIVVTVADVGVERGVKRRNQPASGTHAGDGINKRQT